MKSTVESLCEAAARAAFPNAGGTMRPAVLGSRDGRTVRLLQADVAPVLRGHDVALALATHPWILHAQACTVSRWQHSQTALAPETAVQVDCFSTHGHWRAVLGVQGGRLAEPLVVLSFQEVLQLHPLIAWGFPEADEGAWAHRAYAERTFEDLSELEQAQARLEQAEARLDRANLQLRDLESGEGLHLDFYPIITFDFSRHSAANNLEALGRLQQGQTVPAQLLAQLAPCLEAARAEHIKALLLRVGARWSATQKAILSAGLPARSEEALALLLSSAQDGSVRAPAQALAYWSLSSDHWREGLSLTRLAKAFKTTTKAIEESLKAAALPLSHTCPRCAGPAVYEIERVSVSAELVTFRMACSDCGHTEAYQRGGTWTQGAVSCRCPVCVKLQREAAAEHLPRVVLALEEAAQAAPHLARQALRTMAQRVDAALPECDWQDGLEGETQESSHETTEWDSKHSAYVCCDDNQGLPWDWLGPATRMGDRSGVRLSDAVEAVISLSPVTVSCWSPRKSGSPADGFVGLSACMKLLFEGDQLRPSQALEAWVAALRTSGLLQADRRQFQPLVMQPLDWLAVSVASSRKQELASPGDLNVWREVPQAQAVLESLQTAMHVAGEDPAYAQQAIVAGHAQAARHGAPLLQWAREIAVPEVQVVLQALAQEGAVTVRALRAARDALKGERADLALFYSALLWNYSTLGTGDPSAPLNAGRLALFSRGTVEAARQRFPLKTALSCRRCAHPEAELSFAGAHNQAYWRVECSRCGHWDESLEYAYRYPQPYCDCQACANTMAVTLEGRSVAALLSELISSCLVETHALSSRPVATVLEEEDPTRLLRSLAYDPRRLEELRKVNGAVAWKLLRFGSTAGLLRHLLPGDSFRQLSVSELALLLDSNAAAMSRQVYGLLQRLIQAAMPSYLGKQLKFMLPLCVVLPPNKAPKLPARSVQNKDRSGTR